MSNATSKPRKWHFYSQDVMGFCVKILSYTAGFSQEEFVATTLAYDAALRNLELIGEAATRIPSLLPKLHNLLKHATKEDSV